MRLSPFYPRVRMASIHKVTWDTGSAYRVGFILNGKKRFKQFKSHRLAKRSAEGLDTYREQVGASGSWTVETACRRRCATIAGEHPQAPVGSAQFR